MLLAIDVGNTNTVMGVFRIADGFLEAKFRTSTDPRETSDEIALKISGLFREAGLEKAQIADVILCSVVPFITPRYAEMAKRTFGEEAMAVGPGLKTGIAIHYDNPREVGADRIANAVGGYALFGGPLIVVDLGTAITFDAVSETGDYLGGVIAPGIETSMASLSKKASQLPQVGFLRPARVIGKNTVSSMTAGAVYGFAGMIDHIVRKMKEEMEGKPRVVATGGHGEMMLNYSDTLELAEPDLTLHGLNAIYRKNMNLPPGGLKG